MFKALFVIIVIVHGLLHFISFVKAFRLPEATTLTNALSKPMGIMWLLTGLLLITLPLTYLLGFRHWAMIGLVSVTASQILILLAWRDAKFGTIANITILIGVLIGFGQQKFKEQAQSLLTDALVSTTSTGLIESKTLPEPVQKYYNYAIKDSTLTIKNVRLRHGGKFRNDPNKDWVDIEGEQYFAVAEPGFIWKGTTTFLTADDRYFDGNGGLTVKLLSLIKIVEVEGPHADEAELQRWVAENFWFPINLFTNQHFTWKPIDVRRAELTYKDQNHELPMIVTFNEEGQLTVIECERYMTEDRKETWRGYASKYVAHGRMMIPSEIEAVWVLGSEDYSYAQFSLEDIDYNVSHVY